MFEAPNWQVSGGGTETFVGLEKENKAGTFFSLNSYFLIFD